MLYLGCFFLWGNIDIYVLSYFHEFYPDVDLGFIFMVDLFLIGANCTGYNISTFLLNYVRLHPKLILCIGGGTALTGIFLSSFTHRISVYLSLYTIMNGLGSGTCYMVPLVCAWEYFPEKKGQMTGIIIGAYGFGSFFFSLLSTKLVNPNKETASIKDGEMTYFTPEVSDRVPYMIRTLVCIWVVLVVIAISLIFRKPKNRVLEAESKKKIEEKL